MRIALALGSGGARGYTHIGVIDELHARGHEIVAVAGCSMGAVVGGLEAAGRLDLFTEWVTSLTQRDVLMLLDPAFKAPGAVYGHRVIDRVAQMLGGALIEELPIPFTAVATDLTQQREIWFQRGSAATAMRASIGIPSVFTPVMIAGRLLVDGAVLNPLPLEPLLGSHADLTIGVNLVGQRESAWSSQPEAATADSTAGWAPLGRLRGVLEIEPLRGLREWLAHRAESDVDRVVAPVGPEVEVPVRADGTWSPAEAALAAEGGRRPASRPTGVAAAGATGATGAELAFDELPRGLRTADVVSRSLETASAMIARFRMAASPPDVLIEFPQSLAATFDFHRAAELIDAGRQEAASAFDAAGL